MRSNDKLANYVEEQYFSNEQLIRPIERKQINLASVDVGGGAAPQGILGTE